MNRPSGFALTELMVCACVLAILATIFGTVLVKSNMFISEVNSSKKLQLAGSALSIQLRRDLLALANCGFIHVNGEKDSLVFTVTGDFHDDGEHAGAACICYALKKETGIDEKTFLTRSVFVLSSRDADSDDPATKTVIEGTGLGILERDTGGIENIIRKCLSHVRDEMKLRIPPRNLEDIKNLASVLSDDCVGVKFEFTGTSKPTGTWTSEDPPEQWPVSVRATITIKNNESDKKEFETICPVKH